MDFSQTTVQGGLSRDISADTRLRLLDALCPAGTTYSDQIGKRLSAMRRVMKGLAELAELRLDYTDEIGGEIAMALSGWFEQEMGGTLLLLRGAEMETASSPVFHPTGESGGNEETPDPVLVGEDQP